MNKQDLLLMGPFQFFYGSTALFDNCTKLKQRRSNTAGNKVDGVKDPRSDVPTTSAHLRNDFHPNIADIV
ncbi:hypothetical protein [Paraburkholderia aspalathi]|uniref:Uncharacterized protein n=1 Tax=Paraburkholderia aspalathi TaxID=1324617 RepID=A0A1I7B8L6_9BURK|nr:hypothetical protein [Paraburkholderia aspalathi]SFT83556.1 hypothetical protein SAMN05192563_1004281 [Paraburkholderia aspalathi]